jgi:phage terminase small subunit
MSEKLKTKVQKPKTKKPAKKAAAKKRGGRVRKPEVVDHFVEEMARPGAELGPAYTAAGGTDNPDSASVIGGRLMQDPEIRARIEARRAELLGHAQVDSGEIVGLLASHLRGDMADLLPDDAFLKQAKERGVSGLIKRLEITDRIVPGRADEPGFVLERRYKIEIHSSQEAAAKLGSLLEKGFGEDARSGAPRTEAERGARIAELLAAGRQRLRLVGKPA